MFKDNCEEDYDNGLKLALFHERPDDFLWEEQTPLFMFGYEFGLSLKQLVSEDKKARLESLGITIKEN